MKKFFMFLSFAAMFPWAANAQTQNSITLRFTGENADNAYVLHASGRLGTSTAKLVNTGGGDINDILRAGFAGGVEIRLPVKNIAIHPFQLGDVMRYTGFASYNGTVYTSTQIEQTQSESEDFVLQFDIALSSSDGLECGHGIAERR